MAKIISFKAAKDIKNEKAQDKAYKERIARLDKVGLLEEMVQFQQERSRVGYLTPSMMIRGEVLFAALEQSAETQEFKLLTSSYRRHLKYELAAYMEKAENH